jgi:hypothetical protein
MLASKMPGGLLVELALMVAMEGAATRVIIGGRLEDTSLSTKRIQPIGAVQIVTSLEAEVSIGPGFNALTL